VEGGQARLRTGPDDATRAASGGTAATGAGLAFDAGATVGIAPAGDQPLVALVIAVGPEREGSQPAS
jgi:hypothetical protein